MKRVLAVGCLCLALGMASCKTYCPAYNYAKVEKNTKANLAPDAPKEAASKANS
ncbi:hypothetical protein ACSX1A_01705 [Pontibacter sp. MBLB2868]|uniref:hypothetical protein n=1 Tax=Pontibacter sp. MBLB2868 TaxID=3451555 RepID=UPI003F74F9F2